MAQQVGRTSAESLGRRDRIRKRAEYQRCYQRGRRIHGGLATLHLMPAPTDRCRLGITATRKIGKAVVRQLLRRRTREIFRRWPGRARLAAIDIVVHLRPQAAKASFDELRDQLETQLGRVPTRSSAEEGRA